MNKVRKYLVTLVFLLSFVFALPVHADAAVKISRKNITLLKGQYFTLEVTGADKKVKWSSSKESVATVSGKGKVVARQAGTAVITAKIGKKTRQCKVTVESPYFKHPYVTLKEGWAVTFSISGTKQKVSWSSSNKWVVSIDRYGRAYARAKGTAVITATILGKEFPCKVTVKEKSTASGGSTSGGSSSGSTSGGSSGSGTSGGSSGEPSQVWVSRTGTKYHRTSSCSNMKSPSLVSLSEAKASGLEPCSKCF